jgi:hypothetical protein
MQKPEAARFTAGRFYIDNQLSTAGRKWHRTLSQRRRSRDVHHSKFGGAMSRFGVSAPIGTSTEIIEKLNKEIDAIVTDANIRARLVGLGFQPMSLRFSARLGHGRAPETDQ